MNKVHIVGGRFKSGGTVGVTRNVFATVICDRVTDKVRSRVTSTI